MALKAEDDAAGVGLWYTLMLEKVVFYILLALSGHGVF
jgi:hypothetical protein